MKYFKTGRSEDVDAIKETVSQIDPHNLPNWVVPTCGAIILGALGISFWLLYRKIRRVARFLRENPKEPPTPAQMAGAAAMGCAQSWAKEVEPPRFCRPWQG